MKTNNILYIEKEIKIMLERMKQGFIEWIIAYVMAAVLFATVYAGCLTYEYLTNVVMF